MSIIHSSATSTLSMMTQTVSGIDDFADILTRRGSNGVLSSLAGSPRNFCDDHVRNSRAALSL